MSKEKYKLMKSNGPKLGNENNNLNNIPSNFELVADDDVRCIKDRVLNETEIISHNKPGALEKLLGSVDGNFESAYSTLETNYNTSLKNLDETYKKGKARLEYACSIFELQVAEYNNALQDYLEASRNISARELPESLLISEDEITEIKRSVKELERRR